MEKLVELPPTGLYEQLARIGKVVVHPKRIELLELLCQGERRVEALAAATGLKLTTASAHLQVMRQAQLVETRRVGTSVYYRVAGEEVCRFVAALADLARARLAEVERILRGIAHDPETDRVTRDELVARVRRGDVVVVDVRPAEEYEAGHIAGAISIPLEQLETRLKELGRDLDIVAYCRGPLCLLAQRAVALLRNHGFEARSLVDGMPQWRSASLPVAAGADPGAAVPHLSDNATMLQRRARHARQSTRTRRDR
jgi:rhodanese-related sulfurtransferase